MSAVSNQIRDFFRDAAANGTLFYNECELQHELGCWLRRKMSQGTRIRFERPASSFFPAAQLLEVKKFEKKEIDLVVESPDQRQRVAIELKCPRNGRFPETMFDACRDLKLLEQLTAKGFAEGLFVMHVEDACFYESGLQTGIYSYFRGGQPLRGQVTKPTGKNKQVVSLDGNYTVQWEQYGPAGRFWIQQVAARVNSGATQH